MGALFEKKPHKNFSKDKKSDKPRPKKNLSDHDDHDDSKKGGKRKNRDEKYAHSNRKFDRFGNLEEEEDRRSAPGQNNLNTKPSFFGMKSKENKSQHFLSKIRKTSKPKESDGREGMRLNKYLAHAGICSRREADEYISAGLVSVNGVRVVEMGVKILDTDVVKFNNETISAEKKVYILLNKPKDYVTTTSDPYAERTVMELVKDACKERVFPVGRLDRQTTGVLLLTNDGDLARKVLHPKFNKKKVYHATLDKALTKDNMNRLVEGFELEDGFTRVDAIGYVDPQSKEHVGIELHSGKNRIVRRMLEFLGYQVRKLDRVYFAGLTKKGVDRGHWRFLTDQELRVLKMGSYE